MNDHDQDQDHHHDRDLFDPDHQMRLPSRAAQAYARTVMAWSREMSTAGLEVQRDVAYGPHRLQRYDAFIPKGVRRAPVLIFWHGGGWTNGYRAYVGFMAPQVAALGCVLVAPSYRLAPADRLPCAHEDSLAALRHVVSHAIDYGADAGRIYLSGHSAGAHLAAMLALRRDEVSGAGIADGTIRACLPVSGIMDLHHPEPAAGSLEERVYSTVLSAREQDATLSPLCWTAGNRIPMVLTYGEADSPRVIRSNLRMAALLALQSAPVWVDAAPGLDHFDTHLALRSQRAPWYARLASLLASKD